MFLLKKIISGLAMPLSLITLVLAAGMVMIWPLKKKKAGWVTSVAGLILFLLLGYGVLGNIMLAKLEYQYPFPNEIERHNGVKWVVVLGGGMTSDPRMPISSQLSNASTVRAVEGIRIYRLLNGAKLLFSGGPVFNQMPEGEGMAQLALSLGVSPEDLVTEELSRDTEEQARLVKGLVGTDSIVLVTSAAHMPRSMALFKKAGIPCLAAPTDFLYKKEQQFNPSILFPNYNGFRKAETGWHEYLGLFYSRLMKDI